MFLRDGFNHENLLLRQVSFGAAKGDKCRYCFFFNPSVRLRRVFSKLEGRRGMGMSSWAILFEILKVQGSFSIISKMIARNSMQGVRYIIKYVLKQGHNQLEHFSLSKSKALSLLHEALTIVYILLQCIFLSDPSPIIGNACQWLPNKLTDSLLFSRLYWCDPGVWRCQLKTCWCRNCCWWGSCWQQFAADFEAEVWSKS